MSTRSTTRAGEAGQLAAHLAHAAAGGMTEAHLIVLAGVITALFGAAVAAPGALPLIVQEVVSAIRLRRDRPPPLETSARGHSESTGSAATVGSSGQEPPPQTTWLDITSYRIQQARQARETRRLVEESSAEWRAARRADRQEQARKKRRDALTDARGLPVIALGIVITGVPAGLVAWSWPGWLIITVAAALVTWTGLLPITRGTIHWLRRDRAVT